MAKPPEEQELKLLRQQVAAQEVQISVLKKALIEAYGETELVRLQADRDAVKVGEELEVLREIMRMRGVIK